MNKIDAPEITEKPLFESNTTTFGLEIEDLVKRKGINYIESTIELTEKYELDSSFVAKNLLSPTMIEKIEVDAMRLKLFQKVKRADA
jgi:hypothetical protein